jgi:hypothetical protein
MHRCVYIWWYILQNYNISHVSMGTLAAENLDVCTACDLWDSNIQLTMGKDWRQQIYVELLLILISKSWGSPLPLGLGMPFLDSDTCVIHFCQGFLPCTMPSMDGWWDGWMNGKLHKKRPRHPLLYVMARPHRVTQTPCFGRNVVCTQKLRGMYTKMCSLVCS